MYVCLCYGVTDSQIREAIESGADSRAALRRKLGVGSQCGCCREQVAELVAQHQQAEKTVANLSVATAVMYMPQTALA